MLILLPGHQFNLFEVKVINKVKVIPRSNCKCLTFHRQAGGGPSTERHSSYTSHNILTNVGLGCEFSNVVLYLNIHVISVTSR